MANQTNPQVLALWLVFSSSRLALDPKDPHYIPMNDVAKLKAATGVDASDPNVARALGYLHANINDSRMAGAQDLFGALIQSLDYDPPECPPDPILQGVSALPPA
jgi:hypothetical protein